jgi:hypothetical protein
VRLTEQSLLTLATTGQYDIAVNIVAVEKKIASLPAFYGTVSGNLAIRRDTTYMRILVREQHDGVSISIHDRELELSSRSKREYDTLSGIGCELKTVIARRIRII